MSVTYCRRASIIAKENNLITETDSVGGNMPQKMMNRSVFVTVGTTSFDRLIETFNDIEFQRVLLNFGYHCVVFQIGKGAVRPTSHCDQLSFEYFTFKSSLQEDLERCDLVISHAGAGTCLEVCRASKRLVVVVNDLLMHNHQSELAEKLSQLGHCLYSTCPDLLSLFRKHESILCSGIGFQEAFTQFDTDYYFNVAKSVEAMFV